MNMRQHLLGFITDNSYFLSLIYHEGSHLSGFERNWIYNKKMYASQFGPLTQLVFAIMTYTSFLGSQVEMLQPLPNKRQTIQKRELRKKEAEEQDKQVNLLSDNGLMSLEYTCISLLPLKIVFSINSYTYISSLVFCFCFVF